MKKVVMIRQEHIIPTILILALACFAGTTSARADQMYCGDESYALIADDFTIYDADGEASAYVYLNGDDMHIYGFNGKHLGWLVDSRLYNNAGDVVATACFALAPLKGLKPLKLLRELVPMKPLFNLSPSKIPLSAWLAAGR